MDNLINYFLLLLIVFSPTFIANSSPVIIKNLPYLKNLNKPISERYFWKNKTYRWFIWWIVCSIIFSIILFIFLKNLPFWFILKYYEIITDINIAILAWFLQWFWALFWDITESFIKRKIWKKPWEAWFFWDWVDYIIWSILFFSVIFIPSIIWIIFLILFAPLISLIANTVSYFLWWKEVWY